MTNERPTGIPSHYIQTGPNVWTAPSRVGVRKVQADDAKREPGPLVGIKPTTQARSKRVARSRPVVRVALIGLCNREQDDDNFANACKPLRDAIAEWLGMNDSRKNIRWTYGQCHTGGEEGVIVRIETIQQIHELEEAR